MFNSSGGQRPSPFLLLVRCNWFCCSGFLGSCGWSVRERQTTRVFPTVWQTPTAGNCLLLAPPAGAAATAAAPQHRPIMQVNSARLSQSSVNNHSSTGKLSTWASGPQRSWSRLRRAQLWPTQGSKEEDLLFPTKTLNWKPKQPLKRPPNPALEKLPHLEVSPSPRQSGDSCRLCWQRCSSWSNTWRSKTGSSAWRSSGSSPRPSWTASFWWDLASSTSSAPSPFSWLLHILERRCLRTSSDGAETAICRFLNLPGCCFWKWITSLEKKNKPKNLLHTSERAWGRN